MDAAGRYKKDRASLEARTGTADSVTRHPILRSSAALPAQLRHEQEERTENDNEQVRDQADDHRLLEAHRDPDEREDHEGGLMEHHMEGQDEAGIPSRTHVTACGHIQDT